MQAESVHNILADYRFPAGASIAACRPGFSGAQVWRVVVDAKQFALRRWPPEHPTEEGLQRIHLLLAHVRKHGFSLAPLPLENRFGQTYILRDGCYWEVTTWQPGVADYAEHPSLARLRAACRVLAEFHLAASSFEMTSPTSGVSPGLGSRLAMLSEMLEGGAARLLNAIRARNDWPDAAKRGRRILELFSQNATFVKARLRAAAELRTPLQACLRDIKEDHVLFEGDRVTGLIDFGAMRADCVSGDIARLFGGLAGDDDALWRSGLAAYEEVRPLSPAQRELIPIFDRSGVLLSGMNWLNWIFVERRVFEDRPAVIARMNELIARMAAL